MCLFNCKFIKVYKIQNKFNLHDDRVTRLYSIKKYFRGENHLIKLIQIVYE